MDRKCRLQTDLTKALRLLNRSSSVRDFMLDSHGTDADVALLTTTTPRPSFTIQTEEIQVGALAGRIDLRYLGVPAFSDRAGLSGGAIVTSYAARTHPLHAPSVLSDVRVGRYVRDNLTGEWCIITRNGADRVTRLQYVAVNDSISRERICLTCSSDLFDRGDYLASVLFQCHDREWRVCPVCAATCHSRCACLAAAALRRTAAPVVGLRAAAASVLREGPASWVGTVQVTVCSNLTRSRLLDIDACMDVTSSYQPSMDAALAADMQRLAIIEKVASNTRVPSLLIEPPSRSAAPIVGAVAPFIGVAAPAASVLADDETEVRGDEGMPLEMEDGETVSSVSEVSAPLIEDPFALLFSAEAELGELPFADAGRESFDSMFECAMLPADPSTLPGGIQLCLDGMDVGDDWTELGLGSCGEAFSPVSAPSVAERVVPDAVVLPVQMAGPEEFYMSTPVAAGPSVVEIGLSVVETGPQVVETGPQVVEAGPQAVEARRQAVESAAGPGQTMMPTGWSSGSIAPRTAAKEEEVLHVDEPRGQRRRLAPRPAGMAAWEDGFVWQMGSSGAHAMNGRLEAIEKERKAEERRKKNRQAAARSNARKKCILDGIKSQIKEARDNERMLRKRELGLIEENKRLREEVRRPV